MQFLFVSRHFIRLKSYTVVEIDLIYPFSLTKCHWRYYLHILAK